MKKIKSEQHHWWPKCVSKNWAGKDGCVHWLLPNGDVRLSPPKNFGVIGNGHMIKLSPHIGEQTAWDQNYESEFQDVDGNLPTLISWLQCLVNDKPNAADQFCPVEISNDEFSGLVQGIVSMAVRSPMNRASAIRVAEHYRGPLPEYERNALIGLNMRDSYRQAIKAIGARGVFVILHSPEREFIYGDGFFHDINSPILSKGTFKILAPITPNVSVLYVRPMSYTTHQKLFVRTVTPIETTALNNAVQIYSKGAIFYRSEQPAVLEEYRCGEHRRYSDGNNPVDRLIQEIPGVFPRRSLFGF